MYRQDYILRLIERFGQMLLSLRDRILRQLPEGRTAGAEIQEIAQQAGLELSVARRLDPSVLLMWLAPTGEPDPARFWLMAELLYLEGLREHAAGEPQWRDDLARALAILEKLPDDWRPGDAFACAGDRASEIRDLLEGARQQR